MSIFDRLIKEIIRGSVITFTLKMLGMLLGYILIFNISKRFGPEGVGLYSVAFSVLTTASIAGAFGTNVSVLRYVGQFNNESEQHKVKHLYIYAAEIVLPTSIIVAIVMFFSSELIANSVFNNSEYTYAMKVIAVVVPFMALQHVNVEFIRGLRNLKVSELLRSIAIPLSMIILILLYFEDKVNDVVTIHALAVAVMIVSIVASIFLIRKLTFINKIADVSFGRSELLKTSFHMFVSTLASTLLVSMPLFMVESFSSTSQVGIFSISFKLALLINVVFMVINTISAPIFADLFWSKNQVELQKVIHKTSKLCFLASLVVAVAFLIVGPWLLGIFGKEFSNGYDALLILSFAYLINSNAGFAKVLMNMAGFHKKVAIYTTISLFVATAMCFFLIPRFGVNGAAISYVGGVLMLNFMSARYVSRAFGFRAYYFPVAGGVR